MDEREYQELITPYRECMENMENRIGVLAEDYRDRCGGVHLDKDTTSIPR